MRLLGPEIARNEVGKQARGMQESMQGILRDLAVIYRGRAMTEVIDFGNLGSGM